MNSDAFQPPVRSEPPPHPPLPPGTTHSSAQGVGTPPEGVQRQSEPDHLGHAGVTKERADAIHKPALVELVAETICRTAFARRFEKIEHAGAVAATLTVQHPYLRAIAWLHDVVEDTDVTAADLDDCRIPIYVIAPVVLLTRGPEHHDADGYRAYTHRLFEASDLTGCFARAAKLADATVNRDRCRATSHVPKWARLGALRYEPLVAELEAAATPPDLLREMLAHLVACFDPPRIAEPPN